MQTLSLTVIGKPTLYFPNSTAYLNRIFTPLFTIIIRWISSISCWESLSLWSLWSSLSWVSCKLSVFTNVWLTICWFNSSDSFDSNSTRLTRLATQYSPDSGIRSLPSYLTFFSIFFPSPIKNRAMTQSNSNLEIIISLGISVLLS